MFDRKLLGSLRRHVVRALALSATLGTTVPADAGWLKDRLRDVRKITKKIPQVPIPIQPQIDLVLGTPPKQVFKDFVNGNGKTIGKVTETTRQAHNAVHKPIADVVTAVGGKYGRIAYEMGTGAQRIQQEFAFTAADGAANVLQGKDPLAALAMPLAAAIRDARSKFSAQAQPLPPELIELLSPVIPSDLLAHARYTQGDLKIALPSIINSGQTMFGGAGGHAVTVDNVIVFSTVPGIETEADLVWWAHEIHHVHQYREWGVDQFAFNYLKHSGRVEGEADHAAEFVRSYLRGLPAGNGVRPQAAFLKAQIFAPTKIETPLGTAEVFVASPAAALQMSAPATDRCMINGDDIIVLANGNVLSMRRGGINVGQRAFPADPNCVFDLLSQASGKRYCVAQPAGYVLAASPLTAAQPHLPIVMSGMIVGRCQRCGPGLSCP